jgi:hypothetical protein
MAGLSGIDSVLSLKQSLYNLVLMADFKTTLLG